MIIPILVTRSPLIIVLIIRIPTIVVVIAIVVAVLGLQAQGFGPLALGS